MRHPSFKNIESLKEFLNSNFKKGQPVEVVEAKLDSYKIEHSHLVNGIVYASLPAPNEWIIIKTKWLIQFNFSGNLLEHYSIDRGHIGL